MARSEGWNNCRVNGLDKEARCYYGMTSHVLTCEVRPDNERSITPRESRAELTLKSVCLQRRAARLT